MHNTQILRGLAAACLVSGIAWLTSYDTSASRASVEQSTQLPTPSIASRAERCAVEATTPGQLELIEKSAGTGL